VVQLIGAEDCGPKTVTVIVPDAFEPEELANTEPIELAVTGVPAEPVAGPVAVTVGAALATIVSDIAEPQTDTADLLLESPP
jgi:hypothetical protein